ncbi:hypothetical protein B0H14DRAFT_2594545 [Mycena olivaceomarginata]|nr:hypothetical protein B0H14DRAFT_2594545 [Mycena olivaceomarginata]
MDFQSRYTVQLLLPLEWSENQNFVLCYSGLIVIAGAKRGNTERVYWKKQRKHGARPKPSLRSGVLVPAWRSEAYSRLIHDLENFRLNGTSPTQELNLKYTRVGLDCPSDRIPRYAPYDFGISMEWWKENNVPANKTVLKGWTKWPEPDESGLILERDATGVIVGASYGQ